jgi:transposase
VWKKGKAPEERQHIKLALDTTYILGRGAVKDTFNLLADGIVQVLRGLAELVKCELLEVAEELDCTRYVSGSSLKGQAEVDWSDPQARQRFLAEIVRDAEQVLAVVRGTRSELTNDSPEDQALVAAAELLARILDQDIERDEHGPRIQRRVASDRLISVHDPEMRHGRKTSSHRFNGHKTQVAVDTDSQLITGVEVLAGNAPDAEQALEVVEASEAATQCHVAEVLGDCAYGAGETRAEFAAAGRALIAKVPDLQNQGYFAKTAFQIDLQAGTCTCPNHCETSDLRVAKSGGGVFVFDAKTCATCPLRAQCTRGQGGRTVQVHPQEALLQQARTFQKSPAFAEFRRRRQVVEHRLARLVQLGIRQARYIGRSKTLFQLCLAAAVANLTLLAARSDAATIDYLWLVGRLLVALLAILTLMAGSAMTILASITHPTPSSRLTSPARYKPLSRPDF